MPHIYTEDQLVEQPAKRLFAELGWSVAQAHPHLGPLPEGEEARPWVDETDLLGRETKGEVMLVSRLRAAQSAKPNPHPRPYSHWEKGGRQAGLRVRSLLPSEAITAAVDELTRDRSAMSRFSEQMKLKTN
jgi:type I restriction enzyme R subunit